MSENIVEETRIDIPIDQFNPLKKSPDAIEIAVSDLTENEVFNKTCGEAHLKKNKLIIVLKILRFVACK